MKKSKPKSRGKSKAVLPSSRSTKNVDADKQKKDKRKTKSKTKTSQKTLLSEASLEEDEGEDEEEDQERTLQRTMTSMIKEKESVHLLCHKITENFWETAWEICSERFYHGNAPSMVALELRDTWLRIIESEWLDQDQAKEEILINIFVPDEPPAALHFLSPSTDAILFQRDVDRMQAKAEVGGSGEPFATARSKKKKVKPKGVKGQSARFKKGKPEVKTSLKVSIGTEGDGEEEKEKEKEKEKPPVGDKEEGGTPQQGVEGGSGGVVGGGGGTEGQGGTPSQKGDDRKGSLEPKDGVNLPKPEGAENVPVIPRSKSKIPRLIALQGRPMPKSIGGKGKKGQGHGTKPKTTNFLGAVVTAVSKLESVADKTLTEETVLTDSAGIATGNSNVSQSIAATESGKSEVTNTDSDKDCVPLPPPEIPWDVIFEAKHKYNDGSTLSPSISQEYKYLGLQPWTPSQCGGPQGGVFRYIYETSAYAQQEREMEKKGRESEPMLRPPMMMIKLVADHEENMRLDSKGELNSSKQGSTEGISKALVEKGSQVDIVARIDNFTVADSDQVVDILKHTEVFGVPGQESQTFHLNDGDFAKHFESSKQKKNVSQSKKSEVKRSGSRSNGKDYKTFMTSASPRVKSISEKKPKRGSAGTGASKK